MFGQIPWEAILAFLLIIGVVIGFIAWFVRLEARQLNQETRIATVELAASQTKNSIWEKLNEMQKTMSETANSVARIEGKLER